MQSFHALDALEEIKLRERARMTEQGLAPWQETNKVKEEFDTLSKHRTDFLIALQKIGENVVISGVGNGDSEPLVLKNPYDPESQRLKREFENITKQAEAVFKRWTAKMTWDSLNESTIRLAQTLAKDATTNQDSSAKNVAPMTQPAPAPQD